MWDGDELGTASLNVEGKGWGLGVKASSKEKSMLTEAEKGNNKHLIALGRENHGKVCLAKQTGVESGSGDGPWQAVLSLEISYQ